MSTDTAKGLRLTLKPASRVQLAVIHALWWAKNRDPNDMLQRSIAVKLANGTLKL